MSEGAKRSLSVAILGTRGMPPRYGGRETATDEIGRRLAERGHDVLVYARNSNSSPPRPDEYAGMRQVHLPSLPGKNLDTPSHLWLSTWHLTARERPRPDVAVLSDVGTSMVIPWLRAAGIPCVWWVDGPAWERGKWGLLARWYLRAANKLGIRSSDAVICDTQIAQRYYQTQHNLASRFIPYGASVVDDPGDAALREFDLEPGRYVLFVGRLTPEKGVHYLVQGFRQMATDAKLVIVGDNPYDPEYVATLHAAADDRTVFTGYQFDEPFHQLMSHCAVYVQPSEVEGTSPVLLTAMGYGRPVIVNGIAENRETVGDAGLVFARGEVSELQAHLETLLGDAAQRLEWGARAKRRVTEWYDWNSITTDFESLLRDVSQKRR